MLYVDGDWTTFIEDYLIEATGPKELDHGPLSMRTSSGRRYPAETVAGKLFSKKKGAT
jgi:hypothetical protein